MAEKRHIYTVSELTHKIKGVLDTAVGGIWVQGEISNFTKAQSGHIYFTLKDENSELSVAFYRWANSSLKFKLEDGMEVLCCGRISLYEKKGQCQLYVDKVELRGVGALQKAFEQLKESLRKEGLFDQKHKQEIPFLPQRIGVVTSATGAAFQDIRHVLNRRFANLEIILNPVKVQGEGAAEEVARAIDEFNEFGQVDVLIVGRGGGSLEDLWAFNEEVVARAIFRSKIPVISAVGHEIDYTISDFVADLRAPTPSAAAEQVITHKQELLDKIENLYSRLSLSISNAVELWQHRLEAFKERYAFRQPTDLIEQYQQRVDELTSSLVIKLRHLGAIYQERYNVVAGKLQALSPLSTLGRGYSITSTAADQKIIKNTRSLKAGLKIKTRLSDGALISKIEEIL